MWDRLTAQRERIADGPYAVRFFLGRPTPTQDTWMRRHADDAALPVVDLNDLDHEPFAGATRPASSPRSRRRKSSTPTHSRGHLRTVAPAPVVLRTRFHRDARWQELLSQNELSTRQTGVDGLQEITDVDWAAGRGAP